MKILQSHGEIWIKKLQDEPSSFPSAAPRRVDSTPPDKVSGDYIKTLFELEQFLNTEVSDKVYKQFGCLIRFHLKDPNK